VAISVSVGSDSGLTSALLKSIRDFVRSELGEDPRTLLGDVAWQRMLDVTAVYDQERAECDALLQKVDWGSPLEKGRAVRVVLGMRLWAAAPGRPVR
jgi:hypothetical protein